jgi:hypothetical protein
MPLVRCRSNAVQDPVLVARPPVGQQDHANAFRELQIAQECGHPQGVPYTGNSRFSPDTN